MDIEPIVISINGEEVGRVYTKGPMWCVQYPGYIKPTVYPDRLTAIESIIIRTRTVVEHLVEDAWESMLEG